MPTGPTIDAWSDFASHVSQPPWPAPSSNHDEGCPLNLTLGRRFCDRRMTQGFVRRADCDPVTRSSIPLPLPVADAARLAWPDLDSRVERLRVQGIAVASHELGAGCDAWFLRTHMRNPGAGNHDSFGLDEFGLGRRFRARQCAFTCAIHFCFDPNRREFGRRPERLRRK